MAAPRPSTLSVACSAGALSGAISAASSGDTLSLASGCTYVLSAGLPAITQSLTIDGNGATLQRSYTRGTPDFTVLTIDSSGGNLTLNNVSIQHGGGQTEDDGGAIYNDGVLTVSGGTFSGNRTGEYSGAIENDDSGTLTVQNATFLNNTGEYGGGITNYGEMTVTGSSFTGNTGTDDEGGAIYTDNADVQIANSTFTNNSSYYGAGIYNEYNMTLTGSTFTGNTSEYGGGVYNEDFATLTGDTFNGNSAAYGGGLYQDDQATADSSTFEHNSAYYGGGIYNDSGKLEIQHDTISLNSAADEGGGIYNDATLTTKSTYSVTKNSATGGGGGIYSEGGSVNLFYAQVSGNTFDNCEPTIGSCDN